MSHSAVSTVPPPRIEILKERLRKVIYDSEVLTDQITAILDYQVVSKLGQKKLRKLRRDIEGSDTNRHYSEAKFNLDLITPSLVEYSEDEYDQFQVKACEILRAEKCRLISKRAIKRKLEQISSSPHQEAGSSQV